MDIAEIIAGVIGLVLYWFLTQKKNQKPTQPIEEPPVVQQAAPRPDVKVAPPKEYVKVEEEEEKGTINTFDDLLKEIENLQADQPREISFEEAVDDEFIPVVQSKQGPTTKSMEELISASHSVMSAQDSATKPMRYKRKKTSDANKQLLKMLKNPQSVRNAVVVKEILDRKFDI